MKKILVLALVFVFFVTLFSGYKYLSEKKQMQSHQKINIGVLIPLSGDTARFGIHIKNGVEFAQSELGASNINLVIENSSCDPETAVAGFNKLLEHNVLAIIGDLCSNSTLAILPLAEKYHVPVISPSATSPEITQEEYPYFFRTIPSDLQQGKFAAELMYKSGFTKIAIVHSDESYGEGLSDVISNHFQEIGGEIVKQTPIPPRSISFGNSLSETLSLNPEAIYIVTNSPTSSSAIINSIKAQNPDIQLFGAEGLFDPIIIQNAKTGAENLIVTTVSLGDASFQQRFFSQYDQSNQLYAAQAHDAFAAIYQAISDGMTTGTHIKEYLYTATLNSSAGINSLDESKNYSDQNYVVYKVVNSEFELLR